MARLREEALGREQENVNAEIERAILEKRSQELNAIEERERNERRKRREPRRGLIHNPNKRERSLESSVRAAFQRYNPAEDPTGIDFSQFIDHDISARKNIRNFKRDPQLSTYRWSS